MSNMIRSRTIGGLEDKRVQLSNANFARLWSSDLGTSWTKIRVGCRLSMEDSGASITSTPRFAFGICSGTSNIFMDSTTTHWAGVISYESSWGRYVTPAKYDLSGESGACMKVAKRIGSTLTEGSTIAGARLCIADCTVASRTVIFLDITKGSPNFTFDLFSWQNNIGNGAMADVTLSTYLTQVSLSNPSVTNHSTTSATQAIDEATYGYFNAVNIGWDRSSPTIEISDLAVVKLA